MIGFYNFKPQDADVVKRRDIYFQNDDVAKPKTPIWT